MEPVHHPPLVLPRVERRSTLYAKRCVPTVQWNLGDDSILSSGRRVRIHHPATLYSHRRHHARWPTRRRSRSATNSKGVMTGRCARSALPLAIARIHHGATRTLHFRRRPQGCMIRMRTCYNPQIIYNDTNRNIDAPITVTKRVMINKRAGHCRSSGFWLIADSFSHTLQEKKPHADRPKVSPSRPIIAAPTA